MKCWGAASLTLAGFVLAAGCVGHLEFDPSADPGTGPIKNNSGGSGGQAMVAPGTGGQVGTGGAAPAPTPDAGGTGSGGSTVAATGSGGSAVAGSSGGASGAYGDPDAGAATDATVAAVACPTGFNIATDLFNPKCTGCHSAAAPSKNLDMATAGIAGRMLNKPSTCMNESLISPTLVGNKASGFLFKKLAGSVTGCGGQMPAGAPALSPVEMACVNDWAVAAINKAAGK
jgi:hypothetical protein